MESIVHNDIFKNRDCPPWSICDVYPCRHTPSHDPDWLADRLDFWRDHEAWQQVWKIFEGFEHMDELTEQRIADLHTKLARCQRLADKKDKIREDQKQHKRLMEIEIDLHLRPREEGFCGCGCGLPVPAVEPREME